MRIERFPNKEAFSRAAARFVLGKARRAVGRSGRFAVALSGGKTPRPVYEQLALPPFRDAMPWERVHLFWSDERWVPRQHPESNFGMAFETFISQVPIPAQNVHPVPVDVESPQEAATQYEDTLQAFCHGEDPKRRTPPALDLILLGVGADGHTASLFPGSPLLEERSRWAAAAFPPQGISPAISRVTLTLPVINAARCVLFLASVAGKQEILRRVLDGPGGPGHSLPASMVRPQGQLVWFLHDEY